MDNKKSQAGAIHTYEDFQPLSDWRREEGSDIFLLNLPGFKKDQLRVQLDGHGKMRISGERPTDGNKWSRFRLDFYVPEGCNFNEIRAKFESGMLSVMMPQTTDRVKGVQGQQQQQQEQQPPPPPPAALVKESTTSDEKMSIDGQEVAAERKIEGAPDAAGDTTKEVDSVGKKEKKDQSMDAGPSACYYATSGSTKHRVGSFVYGLNKRPKKVMAVKVIAAASLVVALGIYAAYRVRSQAKIGE